MLMDFVQVDAFSRRPLFGNPAAVVFEADELSTETMQRIAREMNLSETVFIVQPSNVEADYRARIFTPMHEIPFAGHPTLAASHAMMQRRRDLASKTLLRQECGIGIVPIEVLPGTEGIVLRMTQGVPSYRDVGLSQVTVARMLGCEENDLANSPVQVVSTGVQWLVVELGRFAAISALRPDQGLIQRECGELQAAGLTVFVECGDGPVRVRLRTFAPGHGVSEDPVCGSGNGSVAAFLARHKHAGETSGSFRAEQGIEIGRDGDIHASWERDSAGLRVMIGGAAVTVAIGQLYL